MRKLRVIGVDFAHMHMGDNLRMAAAHPQCEVVGVCDPSPDRMNRAVSDLGLADNQVFTAWQACLETTQPDLAILCPATGDHALWACRMLEAGVHVMIEKPFAANLADADAMIASARRADRLLAINWPLVWVPAHRTTKRLIDEGRIGDVLEVHYYNGNRGPLYHTAHKLEVSPEEVDRQKGTSWFYRRAAAGGSLRDYLGYGVTLASWFNGGQRPLAVMAMVDEPPGLEVDEHSVVVARYASGLSKFETRWGTFTDPWIHQPQPRCGFVIVGAEGTIGSFDYAPTITLQTHACPAGEQVAVDCLEPPLQDPIQAVVHTLQTGAPLPGPLTPELSRVGQEIVDAAIESVETQRVVELVS